MIVASGRIDTGDDRLVKMNCLIDKFGSDIERTSFVWSKDDWVPVHKFRAASNISQVIDEHRNARDGHLSIEQLERRWERSLAHQRQDGV